MSEDEPKSNTMSRWLVPLAVIWCEVLLSAWVYTKKLNEPSQVPSIKLFVAFLSVPLASIALLLILRWVAHSASRAHSRTGDLLIIWVVTFLFCVHAAVLAAAIQIIPLERAIPICTALLMIGLGPVLGALEPGSAMGIRTKATLGDAITWQKTHRMAGRLFVLAGFAGLSALFFSGRWVLFAAIVPAVAAVVFAIIYAQRLPKGTPIEDSDQEERPSS